MSHGVLNLPRNPLLDWTFGHSLINCHVEHHLFPSLSDNMCLKVSAPAPGSPKAQDTTCLVCLWFEHNYKHCMCVWCGVQVKPIVSRYLKVKALPYQEDGYLSRLRLFFHRYQELMVFAPPITELVGVQ